MNLIDKARNFAREKHGNQRYGEKDYMYHLESVFELAKEHTDDDVILASALLHDVIEDTEMVYSDVLQDFGEEIAYIVFVLSKKRGMSSSSYLLNVCGNHKAKFVKTCDSLCNLRESVISGDMRRIQKYEKYLIYLATH